MRWQQVFSMHTCIRWEFASFQLTLPLSLSSSISCVLCWVLALITDASAHFDYCEQCACSRGLVYALPYIGCLPALCAHLWFPAFCINPVEHLEVRRRTVVCQRFVIDKNAVERCACCSSLTNVRHHRRVSPTAVSYPESISFPDR